MSDTQLKKVMEAIEAAEAALNLAKNYLMENGVSLDQAAKTYSEKAATLTSSGSGRVIEGVFDGQNMIDSGGNVHPVPANYASKSKLIPGDVLKLTITEEGKFMYKQIGPVERRTVIGPLVRNNGQYQVLADGKAYNVLLASVTYFRASVGDEVTLMIPMAEGSKWGAIEAVLPKFEDASSIMVTDDLDLDKDLEI